MERTDLNTERIRKITIGEIHTDNFTVTIHQPWKLNGKQCKISRIIRDENAAILYGETVYLIYLIIPDGKEVMWRYASGHKVLIEYYI